VREQRAIAFASQTMLRDAGPVDQPRPRTIRRWFGARLVRLGTWLVGIATTPYPAPHAAGMIISV
jgi:hypothetical protein